MTFSLRSPAGSVFDVPDGRYSSTITCHSVSEAKGQWIVFPSSRAGRIILALRNGQTLDRVGDTVVFNSTLDEAGEEFLAVLEASRLCIVRLQLDTQKFSLASYYELLKRYEELFGVLPVGTMGVAAEISNATFARAATDAERSFRLVTSAFRFAKACLGLRAEIPRHPRGDAGHAGVDALATLTAWRTNTAWYEASAPNERGAIRCGRGSWVTPLRTVPRQSIGGNLFLSGLVVLLNEVMTTFPQNPGGMMAAGLLQIAKRTIAAADGLAPVIAKEARLLLSQTVWPHVSSDCVDLLFQIEAVSREPWSMKPASEGTVPFNLPETERVFQHVAVAGILLGFAIAPDLCRASMAAARTQEGLLIGSEYCAWYDTPSHALQGWRSNTSLPSGYRPDLVMQRLSDGAWLLVDAKLRQGTTDIGLLSQSGIKELQAYMHEYHLTQGVLLVPSVVPSSWQSQDVVGNGCRIRAIGVPSTRTLIEESAVGRKLLEDMWNT